MREALEKAKDDTARAILMKDLGRFYYDKPGAAPQISTVAIISTGKGGSWRPGLVMKTFSHG